MWKALSDILIQDSAGRSYALTHGVGYVLVAVLNLEKKQHNEHIEKLKCEIKLLLDQVDYTQRNCSSSEQVGAVLPRLSIERARKAIQ